MKHGGRQRRLGSLIFVAKQVSLASMILWTGARGTWPVVAAGAIVAVDDDNQTGVEDGSTLRPYVSIQAAIKAATSGDTIAVAAGSYHEKVKVRDKSLHLLGGHPGGTAASYTDGAGGDFASRDPAANPTHVTGSRSAPVITLKETDTSGTEVDGFRITGGRHGIEIVSWPPLSGITISNNTIEDNGPDRTREEVGGGIYVSGSNISILNNVIRNNLASRGAGIGGGADDLLVRGNEVTDNIGHGDHGGGVYLAGTCTFSHNLVQGNRIGDALGYGWGGGVIFFAEDTVVSMSFNVVRDNYAATGGGGVFIDEGAEGSLEHELIVHNRTDEFGAGLYVDGAMHGDPGDPRSTAHLRNCTIADNGRRGSGNGVTVTDSDVDIVNTLFWGNGGNDFSANGRRDVLLMTYSISEDKWPGKGNLQVDPLFADSANHDYHLKSRAGRWDPAAGGRAGDWVLDSVTSPGIDAGDPASPFRDEPEPNGGRINLGVYGNTPQASRSNGGPPATEDFETDDFTQWPWAHGGDAPWFTSSDESHGGLYAARSGEIGHQQRTSLKVALTVPEGRLRFWYRVSSQRRRDRLTFYIDGQKEGQWSGRSRKWKRRRYQISAGQHTFRWEYRKDEKGSRGEDAAWLDDISFTE